LEALGLTQDVFPPRFGVGGKKPLHKLDGSNDEAPSWIYLCQVLIALSPEGKLPSRVLRNLALVWSSRLNPVNQSCRAALTKIQFRPAVGGHRLASIFEPLRTKEEKKAGGCKGKVAPKEGVEGGSDVESGVEDSPKSSSEKKTTNAKSKATASKKSAAETASSLPTPPPSISGWTAVNHAPLPTYDLFGLAGCPLFEPRRSRTISDFRGNKVLT